MKKIWSAVLISVFLQACNKHINPIAYNQLADTVIIDQDHPSNTISPTFEGLSFEASVLTHDAGYLNTNNAVLIQLIKNLGQGVLRIGGNSSDEIGWTGKARTANTSVDSLSTSDIARLSAFSRAVKWPVIFGLNLANNNIKAASSEAVCVYNTLGTDLYDLQIGNEPDIYNKSGARPKNYTFQNYYTEWGSNFAAIRKVIPKAPIGGPDAADNVNWIKLFSFGEGKNLNMLDAHYYVSGPASDKSITYKTILKHDVELPGYLYILNNARSRSGLPYRITECNSIFGGGKAGVSDVFASALWALDFMWAVAENKGQGVNFHCGNDLIYSPVTNLNGTWTAHPEYYAMLAFKYGATGGTIIPAKITNSAYNCSAYACVKADNTYSVTLINKEEVKDVSFTVQLANPISKISIMRLSAPSITSKDNIRLAGSTVKADGTFTPGDTIPYAIDQKNFIVKVPAGNAALITIY